MTAIKQLYKSFLGRMFMYLFFVLLFLFYDYRSKVSESFEARTKEKETVLYVGYNKVSSGVTCLRNYVSDFLSQEDEVSLPEGESENTESKIDILDIELTEENQEVIDAQDLGKGSFLTEDGHIGTIID